MNLTERIDLFKDAPEDATHYLAGTNQNKACWIKNPNMGGFSCYYAVADVSLSWVYCSGYLLRHIARELIPRPTPEEIAEYHGVTTKTVYIADGEEFDTLEEAEEWHKTTLLAQELDKNLGLGEAYWLDILYDLESKGYAITKL